MRKIGKFGYSTLIALCGLDIAIAGPLGPKIAECIMPNPYLEQRASVDYQDKILLARLIFGEARGSSKELKVMIAQTALNRVKNRNTLEKVILQPYQFSCFNKNNPNYDKVWNPEMYEPNSWKECLTIAEDVISRKYPDLSKGANHYHTEKVKPNWSRNEKPLFKIDNTFFYKLD